MTDRPPLPRLRGPAGRGCQVFRDKRDDPPDAGRVPDHQRWDLPGPLPRRGGALRGTDQVLAAAGHDAAGGQEGGGDRRVLSGGQLQEIGDVLTMEVLVSN